eukprot:gi/632972157/ref/XP_007902522.1/ PREDICTED: protein AF-17 [Callorhinchus milii]
MKEMVGGCCVCSDERGWTENPLVYCDGHGCNVAVHQACYGIVQVPTGPWFCRKCESQERAARVRCELCPHKDGALKRTDNGGWAHVVCALYVPEVQFANVISMEPIVLQYVPHERFNKTCYLCEEQGRESKAATGACMTCNRHGCRQAFHVTCAQMAGLLCEEQGSEIDNVKYCGYCKYHFNKVKKSRHSANSAYDQGLSDSSTHSQDKLSSLHDKQRKSRKDRERPKQRLKKPTESLSVVVNTVPAATEKGACTPHVSGKEPAAEVNRSESKVKKASGHGSSQRGRKPGGGKSSSSVPAASSTSTFQQGSLLNTPSAPTCQELVRIPKPDVRGETYLQSLCLSQSSPPYETIKGGDLFSTDSNLSGFNPLMRYSSGTGGPAKALESTRGELRTCSGGMGGPSAGGGGYKRPQTVGADGEETVKEKKHKANKKSKAGRGRPKGSKNSEPPPALAPPLLAMPEVVTAIGNPTLPKLTPSTCAMPGMNIESSLLSTAKDLHRLHDVFASSEPPLSLGAGMLGAVCSTPHSSSMLSHQRGGHLMHFTRPSLPGTITATTSISSSQVFSLPGSSYNLTPSHLFGGPLTPGPSISSLINASENSQAEPDMDDNDCSFVCRGSSSRESLSPRSPIGGLPILYDQTVSSQLENVPQSTSNIEQLLEKHWNGDGTIDIVEMLRSLHMLQLENRRLQEQIMSLSAKKERLQLLNVQLSVPFVSVSASPASQLHMIPSHNVCSSDLLNSIKSPPSKTSYITENSLSASSEDLRSGCHSRSSSASSLQSTPPPPQTPASLPILGPMPGGQPQVNGLTRTSMAAAAGGGGPPMTSAFAAMPGVGGVMASQPGNQLAINGIVGSPNGVIQPSASTAQTHPSLSHACTSHTVPLSTSLCNSNMSGLGQLPDQQRQLLYQHQQQQQQQLHQLLTSQQLTPDQHALVYQMVQQQRQRQFQRLQVSAGPQLPISSLLPGPSALPAHPARNSFLSLHANSGAQKVQRLSEKGGAVNQEKS